MSKIKLKPCPFCGGEARLQQRARTSHGFYVICKNCGCRTPFYQYQFDSVEKLREEAITAWNTRKPVAAVLDRLEEYRDEFMDDIYNELREDTDNLRANRIIERFDEAIGIIEEGLA